MIVARIYFVTETAMPVSMSGKQTAAAYWSMGESITTKIEFKTVAAHSVIALIRKAQEMNASRVEFYSWEADELPADDAASPVTP